MKTLIKSFYHPHPDKSGFAPSLLRRGLGVVLRIVFLTVQFHILILASSYNALAIGTCDSNKTCLGNALTLSVPTGKGMHYVEVTRTQSLLNLKDQFTFEAWIKAQKQTGKTQFIAGVWGPAADADDSWVIYIDNSDRLTFELSNPSTVFGNNDNTKATALFSANYDKWVHIAAVFDGTSQTAKLFIDGNLVGLNRNSIYPISQLKYVPDKDLNIQLGSTNQISNDTTFYRAFLGQMDEIRIWARTFNENDLQCIKDESLEGNESGLEMYFRCNETPQNFYLCDATDHGNTGIALSGAACKSSDRKFNQAMFLNPTDFTLPFKDTLRCESTKDYHFNIVDTSICLKTAFIRTTQGTNPEKFKFSTNRIDGLVKNQNYPVTMTLNGNFVGTITTNLQIYSLNRCRDVVTIPVSVTRTTELGYSLSNIVFDTLKANCIEEPYKEITLKICNNTDKTSSPKPIQVNSITNKLTQIYQLSGKVTPFSLNPGECTDVTIRFYSRDTTDLYLDTLEVNSTDACNQIAKLPIYGAVQEVIGIYKPDGKTRLDSIDFGTICVDFASAPVNWMWADLISSNITVDTIIFPNYFYGNSYRFPITLKPKTGYLPDYFRFLPKSYGTFDDNIYFVVKSDGCTIKRPVHVHGKSFEANVEFDVQILDFGNVVVGKQKTLNAQITNKGADTVNLNVYLKKAQGYYLTGGGGLMLAPGESKVIPVTFIPTADSLYPDELCVFDRRCYNTDCIPVTGRGIIERFKYNPDVLAIENILGCESGEGTLKIINNNSVDEVLSEFNLTPNTYFQLIDPPAFPNSVTLKPGEELALKFRYTPNDVTQDRKDRAYVYYKTADGETWSGKLYGTSVIPKLFITENTDFGTIEVGDNIQKDIIIENISSFPIQVDSIVLPAGYTRIQPNGSWNGQLLAPRDQIIVKVQFAPPSPGNYDGEMNVYSSSPCGTIAKAKLTGSGIIVPLEITISVIGYGFVQPCGCSVQDILLINNSKVNKMQIDSIWVDGQNIVNPTPQYFTWSSYYYDQQGKTIPFEIPALSVDTLHVKYCPRAPMIRDSINHAARLHVASSGSGWSRNHDIYLSGKQTMLFEISPLTVNFNPTRVDTLAIPDTVTVEIPDVDVNPDRFPVVVDSISFEPDERVFTARDILGRSFPIMLDTNAPLKLKIDFKPRAARAYTAKLKVYFSKPCVSIDTTVIVKGSGFAPAFGLAFNFENGRAEPDTFRVINCDTLAIPVYSSRNIPANVVDINLRLGYDTNKLKFEYAESPYLNDTCKPYIPSLIQKLSTWSGSEFALKNFCVVDSIRPFLIAKFTPKNKARDTFDITVDSISFDTQDVILYNIKAQTDFGTIIVQQPDFEVLNAPDFDSVRVLDCADRELDIINTGDVPLAIDDILRLPSEITIVASIPPIGTEFMPGDTAHVTLRFCPKKKGDFIDSGYVESFTPCSLLDTAYFNGIGYAPPFPFTMNVSNNFTIPDTLSGVLADTITVPLFLEKDFSTTLMGITYWLRMMKFEVLLGYNPYSLKYLTATNLLKSQFSVDYIPGRLKLNFEDADSLKAGLIAQLKFLVTVGDSVFSTIMITPENFTTDSLLFLDLQPQPHTAYFSSIGKCNLTTLNFSNTQPILSQNYPNPWSSSTTIEFSITEKSHVTIDLINAEGIMCGVLFDSGTDLDAGNYKITVTNSSLESGLYMYRIKSGGYFESRSMLIIR